MRCSLSRLAEGVAGPPGGGRFAEFERSMIRERVHAGVIRMEPANTLGQHLSRSLGLGAPLAGSLRRCAEAIWIVRTSFDILRCRRKIIFDMSVIVQTAKKFERNDKFQGKKKRGDGRCVYENGSWRRI
jgi:hypothetical protein